MEIGKAPQLQSAELTPEQEIAFEQEARLIIGENLSSMFPEGHVKMPVKELSRLIHKPRKTEWSVPKGYRLGSIFKLLEQEMKNDPQSQGIEVWFPQEIAQKMLIHLIELKEDQHITAVAASKDDLKFNGAQVIDLVSLYSDGLLNLMRRYF